ncbi:TPA: hypothetical protein ACQ0F8_001973 [Streptococcus agalactiae]|nr:hypothetical protein [Streptococcus agalactiae]
MILVHQTIGKWLDIHLSANASETISQAYNKNSSIAKAMSRIEVAVLVEEAIKTRAYSYITRDIFDLYEMWGTIDDSMYYRIETKHKYGCSITYSKGNTLLSNHILLGNTNTNFIEYESYDNMLEEISNEVYLTDNDISIRDWDGKIHPVFWEEKTHRVVFGANIDGKDCFLPLAKDTI